MNPRRSLAVAAMLVTVPALASCGSNFNPATNERYNPAVGVNEQNQAVDLLNTLIVSGTNGSGVVVAGLVNKARSRPDALQAITGSGVQVNGVSGQTILPQQLLKLQDEGIQVRGSKVKAGGYVRLTFQFRRSASATFAVPVVSAKDPTYADIPLSSSASPAGSASASGSASPSGSASASTSPSGTASSNASGGASPTASASGSSN